jgi:phage tail-like protein
MDANGLRFWSFSEARDWRATGGLHYCEDLRAARLREEGPALSIAESEADAAAIAAKPARVKDALGNEAFWDVGTGAIMVESPQGALSELDTPPPGTAPSDLALGNDDILYAARDGGIDLLDTRGRWRAPARIELKGFSAAKLAPAADGGVWALDRGKGLVARSAGAPLRDGIFAEKNANIFTPVEPNPDPPRLLAPAIPVVPFGQRTVAIACSSGGRVAVLAWRAGGPAAVHVLGDGGFTETFSATGLQFPVDLAWVAEDRIALLAAADGKLAGQAFVYNLENTGPSRPGGAVYPLIGARDEPFYNMKGEVPSYGTAGDGALPLRPVSSASYARNGEAIIGPLDSKSLDTVWHRLYLECDLPEHCAIRVFIHAGNRSATLANPAGLEWHEHRFGGEVSSDAPSAAWLDAPSELPGHQGMLGIPRVKGRAGLFSVLIQRAGRAVRRLAGRYLWIRIEIEGDTRRTPRVAAMRVYAGRFSYRDRYLPALYHENLHGIEADKIAAASPPDFLERFLGLVEEPLTQLEDKIAFADVCTNPASARGEDLPWLSQWVGLDFLEGATTHAARQKLLAAPYTARMHGTLGGLLAALELESGGTVIRGGSIGDSGDAPRPGDLALAHINGAAIDVLTLAVTEPGTGSEPVVLAGGGVTRGEIVVVEGFRMRRTFATILGANLRDEENPLTLGLSASGNSFIGDTLFLGEDTRRAMALFADDPQMDFQDRNAVAAYFDELAYRVTVLVHDAAAPQDFVRQQRVAEAASPAHVAVSVKRAAYPFLVGIASLVGVDTFLAPKPPRRVVDIGRSRIGVADLLGGDGLFRGHNPGLPPERPVAVADGPEFTLAGRSFTLSAARSRPTSGGRIADYIWTWEN